MLEGETVVPPPPPLPLAHGQAKEGASPLSLPLMVHACGQVYSAPVLLRITSVPTAWRGPLHDQLQTCRSFCCFLQPDLGGSRRKTTRALSRSSSSPNPWLGAYLGAGARRVGHGKPPH